MQRDTLSRRTVLAVAAGCTLTSTGVASVAGDTADTDGGTVTRTSFPIREGTDEETTVFVTTADAEGPTAVVVGGIHGNEVAGYTAANQIADWTIDAGTLVVIPEANAVAIERGTRNDEEGTNLNRQFPEGETPQTELARAIWDVISEYDPDVVVDLHESTDIYAGDPTDGVGQAIFYSDGDEATAVDTAEYVTRNYVDDPALAFQTGPFSSPDSEPNGLLVHKAARDLNADAFLAETLSTDVALETRVQWHRAIVERLLETLTDAELSADDGNETTDTEPPVARIETVPPDAAETTLESGQTVTLDASQSRDPDGNLVRHEWRVGDDDAFDRTGETIEVTISENGEQSVVLRVVDDDGATDTDRITLSAGC
ncbi:succinylglutamate desuccinylase/aspartoacylase family protein [Natrinema hispanicum]|uniref:Succinylglutamate desuccinylase/aspartoacylase family protein n=1 Tax=Natrinema hispanicum TaxID=392421 RepID=A0A482Y9W6_9EURY|nr:succinylglutamate desuccinylase/aspartoacylase family protein [Natrinema hispanicum]RZV08824.1 succinylglutamate desuccinylase/aspartoacylase family protein [Natrinema hispanicum]